MTNRYTNCRFRVFRAQAATVLGVITATGFVHAFTVLKIVRGHGIFQVTRISIATFQARSVTLLPFVGS